MSDTENITEAPLPEKEETGNPFLSSIQFVMLDRSLSNEGRYCKLLEILALQNIMVLDRLQTLVDRTPLPKVPAEVQTVIVQPATPHPLESKTKSSNRK